MTAPLIIKRNQKGFTLVELIAVIVLLGIIGTASVSFVQTGGQAYRDVLRRDEVTQIGRFAIERVSRELRSALPGSVRVGAGSTCIEFVPVAAASIYSDLPVVGFSAAANTFSVVNFNSTTSFNHAAVYTLTNTEVYNLGSHVIPIDATVSVLGNEATYTFSTTPQQFAEHSPGRRIYFVSQPVSFCIVANQLLRYENYGYNATAALPPSATGVLLAEFIQTVSTPFNFTGSTLQRNAIVHLNFDFIARDSGDEFIRFNHDVALRGLP